MRTQVFYNARGSLTGPPYAELNVDERKGGAERLVVAIHDLDLLTIAVHRYSPGGSFKSARATITVEALDAQQHMTRVIATRTVTHESPAEWWLVLEMDADEIYWNDTFSVKPPLPL